MKETTGSPQSVGKLICATCGAPAACNGKYEDMEEFQLACDDCCGHGCEDGICYPVVDDEGELTEEGEQVLERLGSA